MRGIAPERNTSEAATIFAPIRRRESGGPDPPPADRRAANS